MNSYSRLQRKGALFVLLLSGTSSLFVPHANCFEVRRTIQGGSTRAWKTAVRKSAATSNPEVSMDSGDDDESGPTLQPSTMDLPWTDFQKWALRDNISKYLVSIPRPGTSKPQLFALWRTMSREITELSGYPTEMLQKQLGRLISESSSEAEGLPPSLHTTPDALPLLDEYTFSSTGGLSGKVYGIPGLMDGTTVQTSTVKQVEVTLPKGFVQTEDGAVAYELGVPLRTELGGAYSFDGFSRTATRVAQGAATAGRDALSKTAMSKEPAGMLLPNLLSDTADSDLARLGITTAIVLAGAEALNLLSHHLTVNVFWV